MAAPTAGHGRARAGARGRGARCRHRCLVSGAGEGRGEAASRACCCGAASPPPGWLGWGRKSRRDESRRGPFLDTWGAVGLPWGRDKTAVSIVGSLDPERLDAALEGTGDGLAARFLYVWPGPAPYRSLRALKPTREDEAVNALQRIARAVGIPEQPLVLAFEDKAVDIFDGCLERLHGETLQSEGLLAGWLGKGRGTVARLAAVLALLDWTANRPNNAPPPTVIRDQHLLDAWALWDRYYRPHAEAVFDRAGPADGDRQGRHKVRQHARRVIGWIRTRRATEISREDVRREVLCQRINAAGADEVILGARGGRRVARGRRRGGLSGPRPPGAALAGQSGAAAQNQLRKLRKVPASPAQLGRCRRHATTEGSEASAQRPSRKIACANCGKAEPRPELEKRERERPAGQNDQRDDKADPCLCWERATLWRLIVDHTAQERHGVARSPAMSPMTHRPRMTRALPLAGVRQGEETLSANCANCALVGARTSAQPLLMLMRTASLRLAHSERDARGPEDHARTRSGRADLEVRAPARVSRRA